MGLDYLCCEPITGDRELDTDSSSSADEIRECDYDTQVTKLYRSIEERQWEDVLYFLETGKWCSTGFFSNLFARPEDAPAIQARTWVTALDSKGNVRWCQLPLHAAVTFLAPFAVIQRLVETYPKSVRCADDQDMLPLHYAFRFGVDDDVLLYLLEQFPQAITKKAVKDRLPLDLAPFGPRPERGSIIDYYMQSAVKNAKNEWDSEYEKMVVGMRNVADIELRKNLQSKTSKLVATMAELNKTKQELSKVKHDLREARRELTRDNESLRSSRSMRRNPSIKPSGTEISPIEGYHDDDDDDDGNDDADDIQAIQAPKKYRTRIRSLNETSSQRTGSRRDDGSYLSGTRSVDMRDEDSRRSTTKRSVSSNRKGTSPADVVLSNRGSQPKKSRRQQEPPLRRGIRMIFGSRKS